ncbi:MAG: IS110 family RNA-guided transposase [Burkholderiales bacterium]
MMGWTPSDLVFRHHRAIWPHVAWVSALNQRESEMNATAAGCIVGIDVAKSVFQLAVADGAWRVIGRHRLTRAQMERWFANRAVDLVVMEACGSAHHWARWLNGLGIEVKLLPALYVRAYVKRNKTDAADACALLEAARCAQIVPVKAKSIEQQALQGLHRTRSLWMGTRTSRINALRGFCREFGIDIAQGARLGIEKIERVLADAHSAVPELIRGTMKLLVEEIRLLEARTAQLERELTLNRPPVARLHHTAHHPWSRAAHRHRHGGRHQRQRAALRRCAALRLLVRTDTPRALLG